MMEAMDFEDILQENQRCTKFTDTEQQLLHNLVKKYKNFIICKKTEKVLPKTREAAWVRLAEEFNTDPEVEVRRTVSQLKNKWDYMKRVAKKEVSAFKKECKSTDGKTPPPQLNDTPTFFLDTVGESIERLPSKFDPDEPNASLCLKNINESKQTINISTQDCESTPYYSEQKINNDYHKTPAFNRIKNKKRLLRKNIGKSQNFINISTPQYTRSKLMELTEKKIDLVNGKLNCDEKKELEIEILKKKSENLSKENERILLECKVQGEEIEIKKLMKQKLEIEILLLKKQFMNTNEL